MAWSQQETMADCCWWPMLRKNQFFMVIKSIAIGFIPAKQVGLKVNTVIGDAMDSQNSNRIEQLSSDDVTWFADWVQHG